MWHVIKRSGNGCLALLGYLPKVQAGKLLGPLIVSMIKRGHISFKMNERDTSTSRKSDTTVITEPAKKTKDVFTELQQKVSNQSGSLLGGSVREPLA